LLLGVVVLDPLVLLPVLVPMLPGWVVVSVPGVVLLGVVLLGALWLPVVLWPLIEPELWVSVPALLPVLCAQASVPSERVAIIRSFRIVISLLGRGCDRKCDVSSSKWRNSFDGSQSPDVGCNRAGAREIGSWGEVLVD
jgi:hypothetical protein